MRALSFHHAFSVAFCVFAGCQPPFHELFLPVVPDYSSLLVLCMPLPGCRHFRWLPSVCLHSLCLHILYDTILSPSNVFYSVCSLSLIYPVLVQSFFFSFSISVSPMYVYYLFPIFLSLFFPPLLPSLPHVLSPLVPFLSPFLLSLSCMAVGLAHLAHAASFSRPFFQSSPLSLPS